MADYQIELTPEQEAQIREMLEPLEAAPAEETFSPLQKLYTSDMEAFAAPEPEEASGEEAVAAGNAAAGDEPIFAPPAGDDLIDFLDDPPPDGPDNAAAKGEAAAPAGDMFDLDSLSELGTPAQEEELSELDEAAEEGAELGLDDLFDDDAAAEEPIAATDDGDADDGLGDLDLLGGDEPQETADPLDDFLGGGGDDLGDLGGDDLGDLGGDDLGDLGDFGDLDSGTGTPESDDPGGLDLDFDDLSLDEPAAPAAATGGASANDDDDLLDLDLGLDSEGDGLDIDPGGLDDLAGAMPSAEELAEMSEQAQMGQGIGEEFSDEELARIRTNLLDYPPGLRKSVIDSIVNEKIERSDQRLVVNMISDQADPESLADYLEPRLGYRPDTTPSQKRSDGVEIIYADGLSPDDLEKRRRRAKIVAAIGAAAITVVASLFGGLYLYERLSISGLYKRGLEQLVDSRTMSGEERDRHKEQALELYDRALDRDKGRWHLDYMRRYGLALLHAGYYDEAFEKLFGRVSPDYNWSHPQTSVPLVRLAPNSPAMPRDARDFAAASSAERRPLILAADNEVREVERVGAWLLSRLRDGETDRETALALARFHSWNSRTFTQRESGARYKNDELGIEYYRTILTLLNRPDDIDALAGIGEIYYNRREFVAAARQYTRILDRFPADVNGHAGLLQTYLEIWKSEQDPRFVIQRHRVVRTLGIENKLPIYVTTKLAGFYIDLDEDDLRIRFQVDPVEQASGMHIRDMSEHLLDLGFRKEERRGDEVIIGSRYGEGYYQRGRMLMARGESQRALQQFQNAHQFSPGHYLAVNAMGEYYKSILDFEKAADYFTTAIEIQRRIEPELGRRPEDEVLIDGDIGKIYYTLASLPYLRYAGVSRGTPGGGFPDRRIYPVRSQQATLDPEIERRREQLNRSRDLFTAALDQGLRDRQALINLYFRLGWIDYINGDFVSALEQWSELEAIYVDSYSNPNLYMARGNAYFYTDQTRAALGNYLKVLGDYERKAERYTVIEPTNPEQRMVYLTLAAVHNNIGTVYEKEHAEGRERGISTGQLEELERQALLHYWTAVENSRRLEHENEIARTNVQLAFKSGLSREPLLDDWISPTLESAVRQR